MKVPFAFPEIGSEEIDEIVAVIKSGWLTTASRCAQFEKDFAKFVGVRHAIAVNSGTAALHLGVESLGIGEGDKVMVPTFTFTATAEVVRYLRADPIFVDCDPETFCITGRLISNAITNNQSLINDTSLKVIIPVHFGGHPCDMDTILEFANNYNLRVIEDAAHALPTYCRSLKLITKGSNQKTQNQERTMIGTIGDITCFSFYANKTMTTGEGGMLCTDDDDIAGRVKIMRLHGIDRDVWDRFSTGTAWEYDVVAPGFKYNMADINAALGIHQLKKIELFRGKRERIVRIYYEELGNIPGLILPRIHCELEDHAWHIFIILIDRDKTRTGIGRDEFMSEMTRRNIGTSVHYKPIHRMKYYKEKYGLKSEMFPNAEWVFERCVSIPLFSTMTDEQIDYVIQSIKDILL